MFCVSDVHRRVVEGRGVGSPGRVVHTNIVETSSCSETTQQEMSNFTVQLLI